MVDLGILKNPIVVGILLAALTYLYIWWGEKKRLEKNPKAKRAPQNIITPIIVGAIGWFIASNYFNVTAEYTTEVNITVLTVNKENEVIPGVNVKLFSNNREKNGRYTNINGVTNSEGEYTFTIGMGHYTFKASKNDIFGEKSSIFNDEKLPHDITIFME